VKKFCNPYIFCIYIMSNWLARIQDAVSTTEFRHSPRERQTVGQKDRSIADLHVEKQGYTLTHNSHFLKSI